MGQISEAKLGLVRGLIEQAPDAAIRNLLMALTADGGHDAGLTRVQRLVETEADDRRARNLVFAPIAPLCAAPGPFRPLTFPPRALALIWKTVKQEAAADVAAAKTLLNDWRDADSSPEVFDRLCAFTAAGLRAEGGPFAAAAAAADQGGGAETLAACLDIAPVTRHALAELPEWLGRMTGEKAAKLRLAYRDAGSVSDDSGPLFFEMLAAQLTEPWLILRVISGAMDRPAETYVSSSELASFGERVLAGIDARLVEVAAFRPTDGRQRANAVAHLVHVTTTQIAELDQSFQLTPNGVWGRRVAQQKKSLAAAIEGLLKTADGAVAAALPMQTVRVGPRTRKGPRLSHPPDQVAVDQAASLLAFIEQIHNSAANGGFASSRAKTIELLEQRLDKYVEEVLEELRDADTDVDPGLAREFLEIAAEFCGLCRDEKAAQIVRRRAAAA
jgi:hypothetical protein